DMQQAVPAKLRRRRITPPVQQVQLRGLGAPQTPAVDHLEQRRVAVGRQRTLTFASGRALNLVVGVVQEPLQLPPGKWPGLRAALVLTQVRDRVPLVTDRHRERTERRSEEHTSELQSLTNLVC